MSGWLITGAGGLLGGELRALLPAHTTTALTRHELDVTDPDAVTDAVAGLRPSVVVNCAAWTDVDGAEAHEAGALAVNATAVRALARACRHTGARLLHVSTDYVFDGTGRTPYAENVRPAPRTAYGRTKLAGERAALTGHPAGATVVRTAWLYGAAGRTFVGTMTERARAGEQVRVVDDQHGQPTWARDVAARLLALGTGPARPGILHATAGGRTTWYELAREVYRLAGADPALVTPIGSADLNRPAPRPAWSVLGHEGWHATGLSPLRHWRTALHDAFPAFTTPVSDHPRSPACAR
ncbi:dTDP-4-dehydrorhamnose reductase [Streptomyces cinnamoneus]|uniref:dTDP-4-dehydrorhamnose reductase n=1 Tax=Streptomyces cinnamoneus TaxID=53446 RepID=A0A918TKI2_STRCJ|nr:dTDP-4-dehydrorhamnose reductase [Streptomyces cinnamoneus]GHC51217.1 NAD(P)-dependent oxidoreductase [Streptomyces cinnamoneus]